jgi:transcriptional regulator with XRE-family HTH domain
MARKRDSFASRIAALRQQNALTASDLAKLANVTPAAVWNWEKNGITPRPATIDVLASKLGVTPKFLLTGEQNENQSSELPPFHLRNMLARASLEELVQAIEARGFTVSVQSTGDDTTP